MCCCMVVSVVYLLVVFYVEWHLSMKVVTVLFERARKMKKLTVLCTFCWVLLVSQILAISSLYNNDGLQDIPGTPSVISLVDHQSSELNIESKLEENIEATLKNISHQLGGPLDDPEELQQHQQANLSQQEQQQEVEVPSTHSTAQTVSEKEALLEEKIQDSGGGEPILQQQIPREEIVEAAVPNVTAEVASQQNVNLTEENPMPVFSEWAQKQMMAEAEKKQGESVNASAMKRNSKPPGNKMPQLKPRAKNYAAPDCGAKIIASNPEAQSTGSVLTSHKDEYMLNPCTSKIWFVVELCEPIQAERVEFANFELFSSSPKDFSVSVSNRFPTRDWSNVGQFTAKDERDVQSFNLHPHLFGKFIRVEVHSHYNSEHYCPVSLFRVYGTSEFEAFETDNTPSLAEEEDGLDDDELVAQGLELGEEGGVDSSSEESRDDGTDPKGRKAKNNILKSAGEAVLNIVKKAAEALGKTNENDGDLGNGTESEIAVNLSDPDTTKSPYSGISILLPSPGPSFCFTPAFQPLCVGCSPELRTRLERTLSCKHNLLTSLLSLHPISASFEESQHLLCANILGFKLKQQEPARKASTFNLDRSMLRWLPVDFIAGFCNLKAHSSGMIKTGTKYLEVPSTEQQQPQTSEPATSSTSQPTRTGTASGDVQNDTAEQPSLGIIPSPPVPIQNDSKLQPSGRGEKEDQNKTPSSSQQDDVNIYNVQQTQTEPAPAQVPSTLEEGEVVSTTASSASSTTTTTESTELPEKDDPSSLEQTTVSSFEDLDDNLLLDQQLDGTGGSGSIPTITSSTTTTPMPGTVGSGGGGAGSPQKVQPESVFLRLSNRIKALERNMSLSGQYLEELSRRYRKQVEELQHSYAKTLHEIEEQNRRMRESEASLRDENDRLREEFFLFRDSLLSWRNIAVGLGGFVTLHVVVVCALVRSCRGGGGDGGRDSEREAIDRELAQVGVGGKPPAVKEKLLRRNSIDGLIAGGPVVTGSLKKKRPSEEALNITGTYENLMIVENGGGDNVKVERKKKHKRKISAPAMGQQQNQQTVNGNGKAKRASSVEPPAKPNKPELARTESAPEPRRQSPERPKPDENNRIEELPLLEDNDEFIIPTALDLSYNEFMPDSTSETVRTNGMISSSSSIDSKSTTKSGKGRRLSSPAFFKSSLLRSSISRKSSGKKSTPSQNVSSASSNVSSSASSNVRININVHSPSNSSHGHGHPEEDPADVAANTPITSSGGAAGNNNTSWEWYKLKKSSSQDKFTKHRKAKSESPEVETVPNGINGKERLKTSVSFSGSGNSEKKLGSSNGGSFRRLFRKVF